MLTIKRYPNRKFYNPETRQYITLQGIAGLIRQGTEIQVIDNASGEDLTTLVLTQVILEQEKQQSGFMPRSILTGLVQASGYTLSRMRQALSETTDWQRQVDEAIEERLARLSERGEISEAEAAGLRQKLIRPDEPAPAEMEESAYQAAFQRLLAEQDLPSRQELDVLNSQLDDLLEQLASLDLASGEGSRETPDEPG